MKEDYVNRISKILLCHDFEALAMEGSMPLNSDEPLFLAADVFKDTLLQVGVDESFTDLARQTFYTLK